MAEADAAAREVVGRHFHDHAIADAGADAELAHLAGGVGEDLVIVVELHAEISVRQHLSNGAVEFEHLFFRHPQVLLSEWISAALRVAPRGRRFGPPVLHESDRG